MIHHDAVIIVCSEALRNIDLGNIPHAKEFIQELLDKAEKEKKLLDDPENFKIKDLQSKSELKQIIEKINELIKDRNARFLK